MMMYGRGFGMSAYGLLGLLGVALCLALVVVVVVLAVRYFTRMNPPAAGSSPRQQAAQPPMAQPRPEPLEILRERFARGEITLDEFETAKRALGYPSSPTPPPPGPG